MKANGVDPTAPIRGVLLTGPGGRGVLTVRPMFSRATGRTSALRVRVETEGGIELVNVRAVGVELQLVQAPDVNAPIGPGAMIKNYPGKMWFTTADGSEVGFLPDSNAGVYALPFAVELPRKGASA